DHVDKKRRPKSVSPKKTTRKTPLLPIGIPLDPWFNNTVTIPESDTADQGRFHQYPREPFISDWHLVRLLQGSGHLLREWSARKREAAFWYKEHSELLREQDEDCVVEQEMQDVVTTDGGDVTSVVQTGKNLKGDMMDARQDVESESEQEHQLNQEMAHQQRKKSEVKRNIKEKLRLQVRQNKMKQAKERCNLYEMLTKEKHGTRSTWTIVVHCKHVLSDAG
ncbi:unnamed protein product, partial [Amoebophrya sp. A120]